MGTTSQTGGVYAIRGEIPMHVAFNGWDTSYFSVYLVRDKTSIGWVIRLTTKKRQGEPNIRSHKETERASTWVPYPDLGF